MCQTGCTGLSAGCLFDVGQKAYFILVISTSVMRIQHSISYVVQPSHSVVVVHGVSGNDRTSYRCTDSQGCTCTLCSWFCPISWGPRCNKHSQLADEPAVTGMHSLSVYTPASGFKFFHIASSEGRLRRTATHCTHISMTADANLPSHVAVYSS